jgi:hypothetical protein
LAGTHGVRHTGRDDFVGDALVNSRTYHNRRVRRGAFAFYGQWRSRYRLVVSRFAARNQDRFAWWQVFASPWALAGCQSTAASPP